MNPIQHVHIISHTHWDREWYLNSRFTNEWLVPFFESLFAMLDKEPHYRFILDGQTSMIEDWLDQLQRRGHAIAAFKDRLRAYATAGRLLIGPYYLQPDWQLVSDEALVRNLLLGQAVAREFGPVMRAGWLLDNFGQTSQAPQIHREFGIKGVYLWRGVEMDPSDIRSEFLWQAPDGSMVAAVYLAGSYRNGMRLAAFPQSMRARIEMEVEKLGPFATSPNILIMNGYDQEMDPDDIVPPIESGSLDWDGVHVTQSTPEEYLDAVTALPADRPVLKGTLYSGRYISVFPGILSSRMYLKTENDARQRQLEKVAEPLAAVAWSLGSLYPAEELRQCWKLLLKNHPHDSICGVSIDDVHTDMQVRSYQLEVLAEGLVRKVLGEWVGRIDTTRGDAAKCWVIVNTALRPRAGIIALEINVPPGFTLKDAGGNHLPTQRSTGGETLVDVPAVPGLGYTTLYATPRDAETPSARIEHSVECNPEMRTLENEFLHIRIHPDGSLNLMDKRDHATYTGLGVFEDGADAGDTYNYSPLRQDEVLTSKGRAARIEFLETGPLRVTVRVTHILPIPEGLTPDRSRRSPQTRDLSIITWLTLETGSPLCRFHTRVHNTAKDHRLRVLFSTGIATAVSQAQTQFDVVEHPIAPERYDDSSIPENIREILLGAREPEPATMFPQREFVDLSDGQRGVAVLNRGLPEYEVLREKTTLALTLFRGVGWIARPDLLTRIGDAGPLIAVPDAQCLRTLDFHYALLPHAGDWEAGQVSEWADVFSSDLLAAATEPHAGPLPDAAGFMHLEHGRGLLQATAVKCSEDGRALVIRFYNPSQAAVDGYLRTFFDVERAFYVTLDEREKAEIKTEDAHTVPVAAAPKAILTVRLEITQQSIPIAGEPVPVVLYTEQQDEPDLQEYGATAVVTAADVKAEQARAADLEKVLAEKQEALDRPRTEDAPDRDLRSLYLSGQRQLDVETARRAYWEARLSATLLQKKLAEMARKGGDGEKDATSFDATLREIGLVLNRTRVSKRAWEYIVDCYRRLLAREGG